MSTTASWISKRPDRCGDACIRETRIPLWVIVGYGRFDMPDEEILRAYPSLTPADLEAAREYAAAHPEEIEQAIRENEEGEEGLAE
jgi:uncharacterized protein (DUF433 family)